MSIAGKKNLDQKMRKRTTQQAHRTDRKKIDFALKDQYLVIRGDLVKLRDDLQKGYDLARGMVDRRKIIKLLKKS